MTYSFCIIVFFYLKNSNIMFKIGQKVICKDVSRNIQFGTTPRGIQMGHIYEITKISKCPCCNSELLELSNTPTLNKWCGKCDNHLGYNNFYHSWRFELIKYEIISNMEIIKEIISERSDITIKETISISE